MTQARGPDGNLAVAAELDDMQLGLKALRLYGVKMRVWGLWS